MKTLRASLLLLTWLSTSVLALAQAPPQPSEKDGRTEQKLRVKSAEEVAAFIHNDQRAMADLWSDDFVVTNPLNKFVNKKQVLGMVESGFLVITSYDRQIEYIRIYGDFAVMAGAETVVWGGKMPNAGKTQHLRYTAIWAKQGGRWKEIARHANVVPER